MNNENETFRPLRRFKQSLSEQECIELLLKCKRGVLSVVGDNGYPYGIPMNYVYDKGHIYFHCAKEGHKIDAINQNSKVSFSVIKECEKEPNDWWYHMKSVVAFGEAKIINEENEKQYFLQLLGMKYFPSKDYLVKEMNGASKANIIDFEIKHISGKNVREK